MWSAFKLSSILRSHFLFFFFQAEDGIRDASCLVGSEMCTRDRVSVAGTYCLRDNLPEHVIDKSVEVRYLEGQGLVFTVMDNA